MGRLIIDETSVYELDEECMRDREKRDREGPKGKERKEKAETADEETGIL